ncbi:MAG: hypothetical protein ACOX0A_06260 [Thermoguttaceae bacterium]|jgi:hypothetical protein
MKFGLNLKVRLGACLLFMTALCSLPLSSASVPAFGADAPETASESTKIVATVTVNSLEEAWNGAEKIADAMQYKELLTGLRGLVRTQYESMIDNSQPIGAVVAIDGDSVAPFVFIPLKDMSAPPDLSKEPFKTLNAHGVKYFVDEDVLFITPPELNKFVSSVPKESYLPAPSAEGVDTIVKATLNIDEVPGELFEAGASALRQVFAELVEEGEIFDLQSVDNALAKYSELVDSIQQLQWILYVDPDSKLVAEITITVDPESALAPVSKPEPTRWNAIAETPSAIFASAEAGANPTDFVQDVSEVYFRAIHDNLLNAFDVEFDNHEVYEAAEEILGHIEKALVAEFQSTQYDSGFAVTSEPFSVAVASICAAPDELQKAADALVRRLCDADSLFEDMFEMEEVEDYKVTSFKLNFDDLFDEDDFEDGAPLSFKGQTFVLKCGFSSDALVVIATFDEAYAEEEFKRIVQNSKDLSPSKPEATFDVAQFAVLVRKLLASYSDVNPVALEAVDVMANAKDAKIVLTDKSEGNVHRASVTFNRGFFEAYGEVTRLMMILGRGNNDEGVDLDELFKDE